MRLDNLNQQGHSRTVGTGGIGYETSSPTNADQSIDTSVGDDEDYDFDIDDVEEFQKFLNVAKSYAPSASIPDIRRPPNTANLL